MKLEMIKNEYEGKLIAFCGLDGCGKTTQIKRLVQWLEERGYKVYLVKQLIDFELESKILTTYMDSTDHDDYDDRAVSLLCVSDRVEQSNRVISQKLKEGYIVISDRYYYSCLANLIARGFKEDMYIYEIAKSIRKPDISFFLNVPVEDADSRVRERLEEKDKYIDVELQKKLHDVYLSIARDNQGVVVSTILPEDSCFERILLEVKKVVGL